MFVSPARGGIGSPDSTGRDVAASSRRDSPITGGGVVVERLGAGAVAGGEVDIESIRIMSTRSGVV